MADTIQTILDSQYKLTAEDVRDVQAISDALLSQSAADDDTTLELGPDAALALGVVLKTGLIALEDA